jgi:hypothetical protein
MEISSFSMGLDEPSFKQQTDGRSGEEKKRQIKTFVRDLDEERRNNQKKGAITHATATPRLCRLAIDSLPKKKKLRNDAPCKRAKPI